MMDKPVFVGTPTFRDYEDYKYGKAWADGWNDAMEFIFAEEVESERAKSDKGRPYTFLTDELIRL